MIEWIHVGPSDGVHDRRPGNGGRAFQEKAMNPLVLIKRQLEKAARLHAAQLAMIESYKSALA